MVLTDDPSIQELNRTFRGKDNPTDVLSFSQIEDWPTFSTQEHMLLGDVVISLETAWRQAQAYGVTLEEEVARLLVHGVLHLVGHDHVHGGRQARRMREAEVALLKTIATKSNSK